MEDLVADVAALLDGSQDAPLGERPEHRVKLFERDAAEVGEVGDLVRDLRSGGSDEVVEEPSGDVLLLRCQLGERPFEVLLDDVLRAAETLERLDAKMLDPEARSSSQGAA